jgi:hypothetical protein
VLVVGSYYAARRWGGTAPDESIDPAKAPASSRATKIVPRLETVA